MWQTVYIAFHCCELVNSQNNLLETLMLKNDAPHDEFDYGRNDEIYCLDNELYQLDANVLNVIDSK